MFGNSDANSFNLPSKVLAVIYIFTDFWYQSVFDGAKSLVNK